MTSQPRWHLEFGATVVPNGVHFKVWASAASRVDVQLFQPSGVVYQQLEAEGEGLYAGVILGIEPGVRYRFRLDGEAAYADPYSRFQPEGAHGPSEVIDPSAFHWHDDEWPGLTIEGLIIYECHVGTFTAAGTYEALIDELPELQRLGVTAIELMPVAECPGRWNWGYDGVNLYASSHNYGHPDDLRRLVDIAHSYGIGVILDVVYNHIGPEGNYLEAYSDDYFSTSHKTPWGGTLNYDGPNCHWVREFAIRNACYWLTEYHIDGLRLDATQAIPDDSPRHLLAELTERARAATHRKIVLIAEDDRNEVRLIHPSDQDGYGFDGIWVNDFHHAMRVFLTSNNESYYRDYSGAATEIVQAINEGFIYQGQWSQRLGHTRGTVVTNEPTHAFVFYIQNHDRIGNRELGYRLHQDVGIALYAVASTLLLCTPETLLLFMGQEFCASAPFLFFADYNPDVGTQVTAARRAEFKHYAVLRGLDLYEAVPNPQIEETFQQCKLDLSERGTNAGIYRLYHTLLQLRHRDAVLTLQDRHQAHAEALTEQVVAIYRWNGGEYRLLLANFGCEVDLSFTESFLTDLRTTRWRLLLATTQRRFGGSGERVVMYGREKARQIHLPAHTAALFAFSQVEDSPQARSAAD